MMYSVLARGNRLCLFSGHSKRSLPHFARFFIVATPLESYTLKKVIQDCWWKRIIMSLPFVVNPSDTSITRTKMAELNESHLIMIP